VVRRTCWAARYMQRKKPHRANTNSFNIGGRRHPAPARSDAVCRGGVKVGGGIELGLSWTLGDTEN
jgi:hypothetical protein